MVVPFLFCTHKGEGEYKGNQSTINPGQPLFTQKAKLKLFFCLTPTIKH